MSVIGTQTAPSATDMATRIVLLRRMIAEPTATTYSDETLGDLIEAHAISDIRGARSYVWVYNTTPPTQEANDNWTPTYDLNAVAANIWEEKAAAVSQDYNVQADGTTLSRNQVYEQYMKIAQRFRSKQVLGGIKFVKTQRELSRTGVIVETTPIVDQYQYQDDHN